MANEAIRAAAEEAGVKLWKVAAALGMTDGNLSRKLRFEFDDEDKSKTLAVIKNLSEQKGEKK